MFFDLADNSMEEVASIKNPKEQIHEEELNGTKNELKLTSNLHQEVKIPFVILVNQKLSFEEKHNRHNLVGQHYFIRVPNVKRLGL